MAKKQYAYKKATDAVDNPWVLDQTNPDGPAPEEQFADFVNANNAKQNNDQAANDAFLSSLTKADTKAGDPPVAPSAPVAKAPAPPPLPPAALTPPVQDTVVPAPPGPKTPAEAIATLADSKDPASYDKVAASEAADPFKLSKALNMPAAQVEPFALAPQKPSTIPIWKNTQEASDTARAQHSNTLNNYQSPELAKQLLETFQGISHPQATNPDGSPKFSQIPVLDEKGQPIIQNGQALSRPGNPVYDSSVSNVDPNNPYQKATAGIDQQKASLADLLKYKTPQMDLTPLMTFAGILSKHPELAANYKAPEAYSDQLLKVIGARGQVGAQQDKLVGDATAAAKAMKDGSSTDLMSQILAQKATEMQGVAPNKAQNQMDNIDARNAFRAHQTVLQNLAHDKTATGMLSTYQTLGNALGVINDPTKTTPQQVSEFQSLIRQAIGSGPSGMYQSTGSEREHAVAQNLGWSLENLKQFMTGDPASIKPDDPLLSHLQSIAGTEQQNVRSEYNTRLKALTAGHDYLYNPENPNFNPSLYARYPDELQNVLDAYKGELGPIGASAGGKAPGAAAEVARQITAPAHASGTARRKSERLQSEAEAQAKRGGPPKDVGGMTREELIEELDE